jgi:hypothetical protein
MSRAFAITAASEQMSLDSERRGETTYTVSNTTTKPLRAWPQIKPLGSTVETWISAEGVGERSFSPGESQQFVVRIAVPSGAASGRYAFRLNMISGSRDVEDESIEGPAVSFEVKAAPVAAPKAGFPWWIVAVAGILLLGGGITIALLLRPGIAVPDLMGKDLVQASNTLATANLRLAEVQISLTATGGLAPGTVFDQSPKAEEKVKRNSGVSVFIRERPDLVRVPKVTRGRLAEAINTLAKNRLQATNIVSVVTTNSGDWEVVLDQEPKPDREAEPFSFVTLKVGVKGKDRRFVYQYVPTAVYVVTNSFMSAAKFNSKTLRINQ